jgi:hypothetical protein
MRGNRSDADRKANHRWTEKLMEAAGFFQGLLEIIAERREAAGGGAAEEDLARAAPAAFEIEDRKETI